MNQFLPSEGQGEKFQREDTVQRDGIEQGGPDLLDLIKVGTVNGASRRVRAKP